MIFWSRLGFLVLVISFACLYAAETISEAITHDEEYYQQHTWLILLAFTITACILWPLGRYLNKKVTTRELIDPKTGEIVQINTGGNGHTLFFIPMEYWAPILIVVGVIFLFLD